MSRLLKERLLNCREFRCWVLFLRQEHWKGAMLRGSMKTHWWSFPPSTIQTRLARAKAEEARDQIANDREFADSYLIAADTIVAVGRRILMKPRFVEEAVACLELLSGRAHRVLTGVCLITPDDRVRIKVVDTRVRFKRLSKSEIEAYIGSREWRDKAGGYAIQGLAGAFVQRIDGSYTNVVGLPLAEIVNMLVGEGFPIHFNWLKAGETGPA